MTNSTTPNTTTSDDNWGALWQEYWADVRNEDWLTARRLLEISPRVRGFFACHLSEDLVPIYDDDGHERPQPLREVALDWETAAGRIESDGFSSTERRLAMLVAALTTGQPLDLDSLSRMGSWTLQVWQVLVGWGTGGAATLHQHGGHDDPTRRADSSSRDGWR